MLKHCCCFVNYIKSQFKYNYMSIIKNSNCPSNIVVIPSYFYPDSNKFLKGLTFSYVLVQPENGYYKNKSITGDIELPLSQFRPSDAIKIIQFDFFMVDMKDNKSNVVTTPTIALNF